VRVDSDGCLTDSPAAGDPFDMLRRLSGHELAAITGAVMAARLGRVPVVLDGFASTSAAAVLYAADRHALDHCVVGHVLAEPGHRRSSNESVSGRFSISACGSARGRGERSPSQC